MDQPTAEEALKTLEPLIGEWTLEAIPPGGEPWPGEARATFEWHDSGAHVVGRWTVEMPEAPDGVSIMGCDAANGTYYQLYSDDRCVCRVYEMSIGDGEWRLWREGEPFPQRFIGRFEDGIRWLVEDERLRTAVLRSAELVVEGEGAREVELAGDGDLHGPLFLSRLQGEACHEGGTLVVSRCLRARHVCRLTQTSSIPRMPPRPRPRGHGSPRGCDRATWCS